MKSANTSRHWISVTALALAYAVFLIWWLNRKEERAPQRTGESPVAANASGGKTAPAPLQIGTGQTTQSGSPDKKSATVTDRRYSAGGAARAEPVLPGEVSRFEPVLYSEGQPYYEGEPVTAYVRVGSTGKQAALTVNQGGEYPQLLTEPGEEVQIRLAFTRTPPGSPIALTAQDGGLVVAERGLPARDNGPVASSPPTANNGEGAAATGISGGGAASTAGVLDAQRQIGFAFRVSPNPGIHRVSVGTPGGETKVLEFWAGPPPKIKEMSAEIEAIGQ